jgi:nucleotide-binding universal stress UspA family protein
MTPPASGSSGRIVVGVDGSPSSLGALEWATHQAELTNATLEIITMWEMPTSFGWAVPVPTDFDPEGETETAQSAAVAKLKAAHPSLTVEARVQEGHPAPILVEASKGADLLVVGCRGHGEFAGMLIGSVSEYCATHAQCPVVVYRHVH